MAAASTHAASTSRRRWRLAATRAHDSSSAGPHSSRGARWLKSARPQAMVAGIATWMFYRGRDAVLADERDAGMILIRRDGRKND